MFKLIDLKNATERAIDAIGNPQSKQSKDNASQLEQSLGKIADMFDSEEGANYRLSLYKLTLMAGQSEGMWRGGVKTMQCWEILRNLARFGVYNHPKTADYVRMFYSGLGLMNVNEEILISSLRREYNFI